MRSISLAIKYLKRYPLQSAVICLFVLAASVFEGASFGMLIPLIQSMTARGIEAFTSMPFTRHIGLDLSGMTQTQAISAIFILMFLMIFVKNVFSYLSNVAIAKLRFKIIGDLRVGLMDRVLEYDMKFFDRIKTGHLVTSVNDETNRIGNFMLASLQIVVYTARIAAYLVLLFIISLKASLMVFLLIAVVLTPIEFIIRKLKILGQLTSRAMADYNHKLLEILSGIRVIKASVAEGIEKRLFAADAEGLSARFYGNSKYVQLVMPLSEICIFSAIGVFFLLVINLSRVDISRAFPFIAAYFLVLVKMLAQLNAVNNSRSEALSNLAAFESYEKAYDDSDKRTILSGGKDVVRFSRSIEFRNVSFSYEEGKDVLVDVTLSIPRGRVTAFVGPSGAGKSTLVNLIPRFYDVLSGAILVDGTDLKELDLGRWRRKIGFISQDIFVFNTSVKDNIRYGRPDVSDEDVLRAARTANAHDFIERLPQGYDTIVGDRGVRLSGGQKQRISIARAIIHDPEVLILDEATSSLDTETERLITAAIDTLTRDRTVIAIAHRLSTVFHADNIIVLDKGRVVEAGSHQDLIGGSGPYKLLYEAQFASQAKIGVVNG